MSDCRARARWALLLGALCPFASLALVAPAAGAQDSSAAASAAPPAALPFTLHGFLQIYYRVHDPLVKDGFRLRKSDVRFAGLISPRLRWRVSFDAGKVLGIDTRAVPVGDSATALGDAAVDQGSKLLQDAALTYIVNENLNFDIGQQVLPQTLEGKTPASGLETIERTLFASERSRAVGLADVRDIGVSVNGMAFNTVEFHAGVFNDAGESAGTLDHNEQKTFFGRVAIHPSMLPGFQIGATGGYQGGEQPVQRRRQGTEIQYRVPRFTLRAETMYARDGDLRRFGWYGLGALRPTPDVQLVARFDSWDRDLDGEADLSNAYERQIVIGGSYALDHATRVSINVVRQMFPNVSSGDGTFALMAFQAIW